MRWYEKILNVRINIIVFRIRFGSGFEYRRYLTELWNLDLSDITTDTDSETYSDE